MSLVLLLLTLSVAALVASVVVAAVTYRHLRRGATARQELGLRLHERSLAGDQRCDYQQQLIDRLRQRQRIDYLESLVEYGAGRGDLPESAVPALRQFVFDLYEESLAQEIDERSQPFAGAEP